MIRRTDLNLILDDGAPHSTGGVEDAVRLCEEMGITLVLDEPREVYWNGWREDCADPKQVIRTWNLTTLNTNEHPATVQIEIVELISSFIIRLDLMPFGDTFNRNNLSTIKFRRSYDIMYYTFQTYITDDKSGNPRLQISIVAHDMESI